MVAEKSCGFASGGGDERFFLSEVQVQVVSEESSPVRLNLFGFRPRTIEAQEQVVSGDDVVEAAVMGVVDLKGGQGL